MFGVSTTSGRWLVVDYPSRPYGTSGPLRVNGSLGQLEITTDHGSIALPVVTQNISLSAEAQVVLAWAKTKMEREQEIDELAKRYPMVADLKEKLEIMVALVKDY